MDPALRLNYLNGIAQAEAGFLDKLNALMEDAMNTMAPHKWKLLLAAIAGGAACVILIWLLRRLVFALCYSLIGTLLLFVGTESLLMAADVQFCSALQGHRHMLTAAYFAMVVLGAIVQLILTRSRKKPEQITQKELEALAKGAI